jgi:Zn-dependent peptidase ImmA (M78 family)
VRADVDDAQAVKTLAHELGHVLLHDPAGRMTVTTPGTALAAGLPC